MLNDLAGSFWSTICDDPVFSHLIQARELVEKQTEEDLKTFVLCMSRETTPLYRKILLQPFTIYQNQHEQGFLWSIDKKFISIQQITDKILPPYNKLPFRLFGGCISFDQNPFEFIKDPQPVYDEEDNLTDQTVTLWLHNVEVEENYLDNNYGAIIGVSAPSSEEYRQLLNLLYEVLIKGKTDEHVKQIKELLKVPSLLSIEDHVLKLIERK